MQKAERMPDYVVIVDLNQMPDRPALFYKPGGMTTSPTGLRYHQAEHSTSHGPGRKLIIIINHQYLWAVKLPWKTDPRGVFKAKDVQR